MIQCAGSLVLRYVACRVCRLPVLGRSSGPWLPVQVPLGQLYSFIMANYFQGYGAPGESMVARRLPLQQAVSMFVYPQPPHDCSGHIR